VLGFDKAARANESFRQLVLARIIEPTSKADSLRVLAETGVAAASYPTLNRRLPMSPNPVSGTHSRKCVPNTPKLGPASLVLCDVSTLYFETDTGDGFRALQVDRVVVHVNSPGSRSRNSSPVGVALRG
jgi:hypothetical protein